MRVESNWHVLGKQDAPVTIVEFTDLQCPFCRRFQTELFPALKRDYIDTGKVRFVTRDLLLSMHPYAMQAAVADRCADDQRKFWEFRDAVLLGSGLPTREAIDLYAQKLGLDTEAFRSCLDSDKHRSEIQADANGALALQIHGTPTFIFAETASNELEGVPLVGASSYSVIQARLDELLTKHAKP